MASGYCYECDSGINLAQGQLACPLCNSTFVELAEAPLLPAPAPSLSGLLSRMLSHDAHFDHFPDHADPEERELAPPETRATGRAQSGSSGVPITNLAQSVHRVRY